ncbi:uncharacterized protein SCHCODRAFT_02516693 [Schizophyllum commune H4-8]|uniref:uncharacterized protein n=1 Tax=Schizophyllum commune (strain H4-8 / FGSC 9210) TaxID=578458 RepID=UPI002160859D|nr:uncharacterized protein SCHCODRAFT_02516693 [Schizophyllum commune H4-8]KAI5887253.1 hypothetical protein SCHCODRAFT_02516693 [Schizophyllum commune H4-8]
MDRVEDRFCLGEYFPPQRTLPYDSKAMPTNNARLPYAGLKPDNMVMQSPRRCNQYTDDKKDLTHLQLALLNQLTNADNEQKCGAPKMTHTYSSSADSSSSGWSMGGLSPFVNNNGSSIWGYGPAEAFHTTNTWAILAAQRAASPKTALFQASQGALYPQAIDGDYSAPDVLSPSTALVRAAPPHERQAVLSPPRVGSPQEAAFYQKQNMNVRKASRRLHGVGAIGEHLQTRAPVTRITARENAGAFQDGGAFSDQDSPLDSPASLAEDVPAPQVVVSSGYSLTPDAYDDVMATIEVKGAAQGGADVQGRGELLGAGANLPALWPAPPAPVGLGLETTNSYFEARELPPMPAARAGDASLPNSLALLLNNDVQSAALDVNAARGVDVAHAVHQPLAEQHDRGDPGFSQAQTLPPEAAAAHEAILRRQDLDEDYAEDTPLSLHCERVLAPHALVQFSNDERMRSWDPDTCIAQIRRYRTHQLDWH